MWLVTPGWKGASLSGTVTTNRTHTATLPPVGVPPPNAMLAATAQVAKHITAIQQRAAVLGTAPLDWAVGAHCHARAGPEQEWQMAVIGRHHPCRDFPCGLAALCKGDLL